MLSKLTVLLLTSGAIATSETAKDHWGCPRIHIFGARHTGATDEYGGAKEVVELILASNPGATAEPIRYPAMGASKDEFAWSAQQGVKAVTSQVTEFVEECPDTQIVLVGYSQGAEIMDDAMCGGPDPTVNISSTEPTISSIVGSHVKAMIWMGNPRYTIGAPFNRGTATASGSRSRSRNISCAPYTNIIQSYCDEGDKFCTDGDSVAIHASYAPKYKQDAVDFVDMQLS